MKNIRFNKGDHAVIKVTGEVVRVANPDLEPTKPLGGMVRIGRERVKVAIEHSPVAQAQGSSHYSWVYQSKLKAHTPTAEQLKEFE